MKRKTLIGIGVAVFAAVLIGYAFFIRTLSTYEAELQQAVPSPDGTEVAYVSARTYSFTKLVQYDLVLLSAEEEFTGQDANAYNSWSPFEIRWVNDNALFVSNRESVKDVQENEVGDVGIYYLMLKDDRDQRLWYTGIQEIHMSPDGRHMACIYQELPTARQYLVVQDARNELSYSLDPDLVCYTSRERFEVRWQDDQTVYVANAPESTERQPKRTGSTRLEYEYPVEDDEDED